jgi:predicted transposase/invertase (TIGR01784 family)
VHRYQAIRLWEQPSETFLQSPGLLPLAVLTQTSDPALKLREVATALEQIEDNRVKANLMAATSVFGGILLSPDIIKTILRSEIMKESAVYQEILREGEQRGLLKGKLETIPLLKKLGLTIAEIAKELDIDVELVNRFVANQNN